MATIVRGSVLAAVARCASDEPARPQLCGVHVAPDGTVTATDGHCLLRVSPEGDAAGQAADFPKPAGKPVEPLGPAGVIVPGSMATEAARLAPRKGSVPALVDHVALGMRGERVEAYGTDLDTFRTLQGRPPAGNYPDTEQVIPNKEPLHRIALDLDLLANMLAAMKAAGVPGGQGYGVILEFHGTFSAMCLRSRTENFQPVLGLLMPLRNEELVAQDEARKAEGEK